MNNIKAINYWHVICICAVLIMITVGGLTRLSESGLSITEWQLFDGILPPLNQEQWKEYFLKYKQIPEYKIVNKGMSLDEFKLIFWPEYIHRVLGRLTGLIYILPFIAFFFIFKNTSKLEQLKQTKKLMLIASILVCMQGVAGWYMVKSGLVERTDVSQYRLAIHLILAFSLLFVTSLSYFRLKYPLNNIANKHTKHAKLLVIFVLFMVFLGALVAGTNAGKMYNTFPLMGDSFIPEGLFAIPALHLNFFENPVTIQFTHRIFAYLFAAYSIYIYAKYKNIPKYTSTVRNILCLMIIQFLLGIITLLTIVELKFALLHQVNAAFLLIYCTKFYSLSTNYKR